MFSTEIFDFSNVDVLGSWKDALILAYVVATAGVLLGVYWERELFPDDVQAYGWDVLVKSLAVELFCGAMIFAIDGRISHIQRDEIIVLQNRLAARKLSNAQIADMKRELEKFSGQKFLYDAYFVKEVTDIGSQISDALEGAGWQKFTQPPNSFLKSITAGIAVFVDVDAPEATKAAANKLEKLLNENGIAAYDVPRNIPTDKAVIGIQIGIKP